MEYLTLSNVSLFFSLSWAFGVVLWEIVTFGKILTLTLRKKEGMKEWDFGGRTN